MGKEVAELWPTRGSGKFPTSYTVKDSVNEDRWKSTGGRSMTHLASTVSKHYVHPADPHCEEITGNISDAWWKKFGWRYDAWKGGKCDPKTWDFVNEVDHPASGVTHRTLGKKKGEAGAGLVVPKAELLSEVLPLVN